MTQYPDHRIGFEPDDDDPPLCTLARQINDTLLAMRAGERLVKQDGLRGRWRLEAADGGVILASDDAVAALSAAGYLALVWHGTRFEAVLTAKGINAHE